MTPLIVGVTSHRNIPAREIEPIRQRVRDLFAQLQRDFPGLPLIVLSALAEGGDQLVAEEALAAGARLIAPLPLPQDLYRNDFHEASVRERFEFLCSRAQLVDLAGLAQTPRQSIQSPGLARNCQYARAGVYIASHCHLLLAIWDGKATGRLGGTSQIVQYHLTGTLPGLIERRRAAQYVLGGGDESLLYHIVCSREDRNGEPAAGLQPLQAGWRCAAAEHLQLELPQDMAQIFLRMTQFNEDCSLHAAQMPSTTPPSTQDAGQAAVTMDRTFHTADWLAVHFRRRVLLAMRLTYSLAAMMGIAFTFYAHYPNSNFLIYLFLLLFAGGGYVAMLARRRDWHRKYLDYRALAEGLRVQLYWHRADVSSSTENVFAHENFLQKQNVELGWIRNVMRAASLFPRQTQGLDASAELSAVIAEWVGESGSSGQLYYYQRKTAERAGLHHLTEMIGAISLWTSIAISAFLVVFALVLSESAKVMLVTAMAILAIIAAVRESYSHRKADRELIRQYRFMQRIFGNARRALDETGDLAQKRAILLSLGDAALTEHAEWTLMHREREVEHSKL